jgi:hypothetical protein
VIAVQVIAARQPVAAARSGHAARRGVEDDVRLLPPGGRRDRRVAEVGQLPVGVFQRRRGGPSRRARRPGSAGRVRVAAALSPCHRPRRPERTRDGRCPPRLGLRAARLRRIRA